MTKQISLSSNFQVTQYSQTMKRMLEITINWWGIMFTEPKTVYTSVLYKPQSNQLNNHFQQENSNCLKNDNDIFNITRVFPDDHSKIYQWISTSKDFRNHKKLSIWTAKQFLLTYCACLVQIWNSHNSFSQGNDIMQSYTEAQCTNW